MASWLLVFTQLRILVLMKKYLMALVLLPAIGFPAAGMSAPLLSKNVQPAVLKSSRPQQRVQDNQPTPQSPSVDAVIAAFTTANAQVAEPQIIAFYQELFTRAYSAAPDIQIARKLRQQKSQQRYTAWAERLAPKVDGQISQVWEFNSRQEKSLAQDQTASEDPGYQDGEEYADWSFNLDAPLYRRALGVQVNIARLEEELAANNLQLKTQELDLRLRELLGNYLESSYRLLNLYNSVRLSREHVGKIQRGYELRDQTRLQLLRAQANLKELEARRDLDEHNQEVAFRALLDFTGIPATDSIFARLNALLQKEIQVAACINSLAALEEQYLLIQPYVESMDGAGRQHYFQANSQLYRKIVLERQLAEQQATTFTQDEYPDLSIQAFYDRHDHSQFSKFNGEGSVALVLSVPLFSGGTIFSSTKAQATAQHIAGVTHHKDLSATVHGLENNKKLISSLRKVYASQQLNLQQQEEIVVLSLKSYAIKQTSMQDLLTSQNKLIDAKNALMQTTSQLAALYRRFAWELGTPFPAPELLPEQ
ncbi:TolC family protein [Desulfogranum mediterraneum]|uniref:TolC family protein n=1 Tax=Desulfogranum mediterraneum TaxID=160661 RepID=UPI0012947CAA|nr:TolC family protein [Desulfogranum mediterraneum]